MRNLNQTQTRAAAIAARPGIKILAGHVSPETAYLVADYPFGFKLRCQIRYWIEFNQPHGFRLVSQTTNPKKGGVWNKPKTSTYCRFGGCMYLDEKGHVQWAGLTEYSDAAEAAAWQATYGDGVPPLGRPVMDQWINAKIAYEAKRNKQSQG